MLISLYTDIKVSNMGARVDIQDKGGRRISIHTEGNKMKDF